MELHQHRPPPPSISGNCTKICCMTRLTSLRNTNCTWNFFRQTYGEYLTKYEEPPFLIMQYVLCGIISFVTMELCLKFINIEGNDMCISRGRLDYSGCVTNENHGTGFLQCLKSYSVGQDIPWEKVRNPKARFPCSQRSPIGFYPGKFSPHIHILLHYDTF
jgi:hypothetical protein